MPELSPSVYCIMSMGLTVETIVMGVCPHLPFDERLARQRWQHNIVHDGVCGATLPLASRLANEGGMGDKADAMDDIAQLSLGIHCLGNATDVTQGELALGPDAALDDCHAARHERNLARDVGDVANLECVRVYNVSDCVSSDQLAKRSPALTGCRGRYWRAPNAICPGHASCFAGH